MITNIVYGKYRVTEIGNGTDSIAGTSGTIPFVV